MVFRLVTLRDEKALICQNVLCRYATHGTLFERLNGH